MASLDRRTRGVVGAAFIAQGLAIGSTVGAFSLFIRPVSESFDATTFQVSAGISLMTLTLAACGVPVGTWLDRGSPRQVMFTGTAIITTTTWFASQATSLWQLAALCVATGVAIPMLGPLTTAAVVAKATEADRGRALGFANLGVPVGGLCFSLLAGFTLESADWRTTLQLFAAVFFCLGLPAIFFGVPKDLGRTPPLGAALPASGAPPPEIWTAQRLLASVEFRLIALVLGVGMGTTAGFAAHVAPYLVDVGASLRWAGILLAAMQGSMLLGTLSLGAMADRRSAVLILLGIFSVQLLAFLALSAQFGVGVAAVLLTLNGIASGGLLPVLGHLLAERFGGASLGRAMGLANLTMLPFGFGLPMIGGALRDATGSYTSLLLLCSGLFCVSIAALVVLHRRRPQPQANPGSA